MRNLKKIPRSERKHARARVFSLNFMNHIEAHDSKAFVAVEDYKNLLTKYENVLKRYKRSYLANLNRIDTKPK